MLTIYHNAECSKSKGVCQLLNDKNVQANIIEYLKQPPTKEELIHLLEMLDMQPSQLIRKNEPVFKELYEEKELTEEAYLLAMLKHPILIERPIIVKDGKAIIGRPPEKILELL